MAAIWKMAAILSRPVCVNKICHILSKLYNNYANPTVVPSLFWTEIHVLCLHYQYELKGIVSMYVNFLFKKKNGS